MVNITIFTSRYCPFSKRLKDFLYDQTIPFEEKALTSKNIVEFEVFLKTIDPDNLHKTPIIKINNSVSNILIGWNEKNKKILLDTLAEVKTM